MSLIKYCRIEGGNFGDDINLQLWERLFPNLSDLTGKIRLYGVGTLLDGIHDKAVRKVVLGTGIGEVDTVTPDRNWDFRWVCGPMTAHEFSLPVDLALGDPAILWPGLVGNGHAVDGPVGLVPHYATWDSFDWPSVASKAGMIAINPRKSPDDVIAQMRACSCILAESLHGAICADAMGIPWAACVLAHRFNEFKWRDWLATIHRPYAPLMMDRPLVKEISFAKGSANRLARLIQYKRSTRHPALRPVAPATAADADAVARQLHQYASNPLHFSCSTRKHIDWQRFAMLEKCAVFANEYKLQFDHASHVPSCSIA